MNIVSLDIFLLALGLFLLFYFRFTRSRVFFVVFCQMISTVWAQVPFGISISLHKLAPFFSLLDLKSPKKRYEFFFYPFLIYVVVLTLVSSLFWKIPHYVHYFYGEGRLLMQLTVFLSLVFSARAFSNAMSVFDGVVLMWKGWIITVMVHGVVFIYQYFAYILGFPFLGAISRPHNMTFDGVLPDVALLNAGGVDIIRPGGLAGEPKTAAVVFGIYICTAIVAGIPPEKKSKWIKWFKFALFLSFFCFLGTFSTSGYVAMFVIVLIFLWYGFIRFNAFLKFFASLVFIFVLCAVVFDYFGLPSFKEILQMRTTERLQDPFSDFPVEVALNILKSNFLIMFFGTGYGGGTFYILDQIGDVFAFSLAPNIGIVHLVLEVGLLGAFLFFFPFVFLLHIAIKKYIFLEADKKWALRYLLSMSISSMVFMLSGSGIALGYPMAIGGVLGALSLYSSSR